MERVGTSAGEGTRKGCLEETSSCTDLGQIEDEAKTQTRLLII